MAEEILLSTAYFPPASYFSLIARSSEVLIERQENYHKQTWRNRCLIMGPNGTLSLVIPVLRGSFHKTAIRDLRIDNGRRWRELHLRGLTSAYAAAPFFEFYFDIISGVISKPYTWLLDLNSDALEAVCGATGLTVKTGYTDHFEPEGSRGNDFRYSITPKKELRVPGYRDIPYTQVFGERHGFIPGLSIIDMLLNNGPGTRALLLRSLEADNC
jgi:hypothetical protein